MTILEQVDPRYQRDIIKISTTKLTSIDDLHLANYTTSGKVSRQTLGDAYKTLHSTVRTQVFRIVCERIPYFVACHLVRHTQGIDPFMQSRRPDISGIKDPDRYEPTNYTFFCNAQSLMNMAYERMCCKHPSPETHDVFLMIRDEIKALDEDLAINMVPKCVMRNGLCPENTSCMLYKEVHDIFSDYFSQFKFNVFDSIKRCNCPPKKVSIKEDEDCQLLNSPLESGGKFIGEFVLNDLSGDSYVVEKDQCNVLRDISKKLVSGEVALVDVEKLGLAPSFEKRLKCKYRYKNTCLREEIDRVNCLDNHDCKYYKEVI